MAEEPTLNYGYQFHDFGHHCSWRYGQIYLNRMLAGKGSRERFEHWKAAFRVRVRPRQSAEHRANLLLSIITIILVPLSPPSALVRSSMIGFDSF